ncbi:unnamed protein product [Nesidiocoris tenuis]|uniref:Uncharacterized protein n=1 Tax=Nesidiocoris tenuis TaxID=355587 RepID=A0A6H5G8P1_9HEMI|nr:unnamed protein product [Nesidiocoris tenuis]
MKKKRPIRRTAGPVGRQESEDEPPVPDTDAAQPPGVPDPYYPIYLPIDQAFKAKYVFHQRRGKTFQERVYVFLEHPGGWICFIYHFTVTDCQRGRSVPPIAAVGDVSDRNQIRNREILLVRCGKWRTSSVERTATLRGYQPGGGAIAAERATQPPRRVPFAGTCGPQPPRRVHCAALRLSAARSPRLDVPTDGSSRRP